MDILKKYASLLVYYCLEIKPGEKVYISSTTLAEPLVREVYREAIQAGAHVECHLAFREQHRLFMAHANDSQLAQPPAFLPGVMDSFDAFLVIRAPFNLREDQSIAPARAKIRNKALTPMNEVYSDRTANRSLRRCLCQYPTDAAAQEAGMSLDEYAHFVYNACYLFSEDPQAEWLKVRNTQQHIVDYLNQTSEIRYQNKNSDITFSVKGRTWINSDGRTNMPSGEVYTGPVEDSVEGTIAFSYPTLFMGRDVEGVKLTVEGGRVVHWEAERGRDLLDAILDMDGARYFGEVAIGTNYQIQRTTKNILFDEKIGGSVHMALGQSYKQTGGKNQSPIHWDLITDMTKGGRIYADGKLIYQDGKFLI